MLFNAHSPSLIVAPSMFKAEISLQRYSQSSVLKRTALELIAEDMLSHVMQEVREEVCESSGGEETSEDDSWEVRVEDLIEQAHFGGSDHISRHQLSCVLQSLGRRSASSISLQLSRCVHFRGGSIVQRRRQTLIRNRLPLQMLTYSHRQEQLSSNFDPSEASIAFLHFLLYLSLLLYASL